jgi:hypothetical protein
MKSTSKSVASSFVVPKRQVKAKVEVEIRSHLVLREFDLGSLVRARLVADDRRLLGQFLNHRMGHLLGPSQPLSAAKAEALTLFL